MREGLKHMYRLENRMRNETPGVIGRGVVLMPGSLRIGRIAGINIFIHVSWLIILVLLTWSLAIGWFAALYPGWPRFTYWIVSLLAALLLFVSVLLHELAHSLVARRRGLPVKNITLFIFGGVSNIEQEPASAGIEFQMSLVGPLTSLLIGGISFVLLLLIGRGNSPLAAILGYLAAANVLLGLFNLLPGFPLDGGRVLRSIIWKITGSLSTATRVAILVGQVVAYLIVLGGIWLFIVGSLFSGIWIGFLGWFLLSGAQSAHTQLMLDTMFKGVSVGQTMNSNPVTVPANISLQKLVDEFLLPHGWRGAFVMQTDQLVGLITLCDVRHTPREQWGQTPVGHVMTPVERLHVVSPQQKIREVVPLMVAQDINQLAVVQDGRLVGVLSRDDIMRSLEIRQSLELDGSRTVCNRG
jgi:Zn-dependent protease/CBS domain-containing protein